MCVYLRFVSARLKSDKLMLRFGAPTFNFNPVDREKYQGYIFKFNVENCKKNLL